MVQRRGGALRVVMGLLAVGAVVGGVSVAAASEPRADMTVKALPSNTWDKPDIQIQTGDTVTWNLDSGNSIPHNVEGTAGPVPGWIKSHVAPRSTPPFSYTFNDPGVYEYLCRVHPEVMTGKVTVTGSPVTPTPTATATATATATGTASPTASPTATPTRTATPLPTTSPTATPSGADRTTPAPLGASRGDVTAPVVSKLKLKAVTHGARVSFTLSETSTVTIRFKRGTRTVRTIKLSTRAGARAFTVRSSRLVRARYTVEVEARDARGNKAAVQSAKVRVKR